MSRAPAEDRGAAIIAELPALRRYARALVGDRGAADDLVQDTLERAWRHREQHLGGSGARAWLLRIMHNLRVDHLRRARPPFVDTDGELPETATRASQADALELRDLERALRALPEEHRSVLLLVGLEGLSYDEAALALDVPIGTVMSRLSRARHRLKKLMDASAAPLPLRIVK